jgi:hypothetical protein
MQVDQLDEFAKRWPTWFDFNGDGMRTAMPNGFSGIGEGWRQLLWDLCVELEPHVQDLNRKLATEEPPASFEVLQVKEKFGQLRFYVNHHSGPIDGCIGKAKVLASTTCIDCGQPAQLSTKGRWHVACDACEANRTHDHEHPTDADLIEPAQLVRDLARGCFRRGIHNDPSERNTMSDRNEEPKPQVGILWLWEGRLILHAMPLTKAERWGRYLNAIGHERHWERLQIAGEVPGDIEYTEPPRGRVVYDTISRKYFLYADICIRSRSELITGIIQRLGLLAETVDISGDEHYRCADCLLRRESLHKNPENDSGL